MVKIFKYNAYRLESQPSEKLISYYGDFRSVGRAKLRNYN